MLGRPQTRAQVRGQRGGRGVVEDQRGRQAQPGGGGEPVAQFDRGERVETQFQEAASGGHRGGRGVPEHGGGVAAHQLQQRPVPVRPGQPGQVRSVLRCGRPHQLAQQRRHRPTRRRCGQVQPHRGHHRFPGHQRGVQQRQSLLDGQRAHARAGHALDVGAGEVAGHAAALCPEAPGHRHRGQAKGAAVPGQGVEEGVGRRVVALAGRAEQPGRRREQHEGPQVAVAGQLVQVPGGVHLGPQHRVDAFRGQRGEHAVVEDTGRVHDSGQVGDVGEQVSQGRPVRGVAAHHPDPGTQLGEIGEVGRVAAAAAGQHQ